MVQILTHSYRIHSIRKYRIVAGVWKTLQGLVTFGGYEHFSCVFFAIYPYLSNKIDIHGLYLISLPQSNFCMHI